MFHPRLPQTICHGEGGNHENLRRTGLVGEPGLCPPMPADQLFFACSSSVHRWLDRVRNPRQHRPIEIQPIGADC
jgi:hypothetical protein